MLLVDGNGDPIEGIKMCFNVATEEKTIATDGKGCAFLAAEEGASTDTAEVEIVWEN
ncbi:MAG: hypothetical protein JW863_20470 [Chitinispirillaceae bacterium]|nr:hypothetical protein [Chitinispirillaceae bacterium]